MLLRHQVTRDLLARIEAGEWPVGQRIPPVRDLIAEYSAGGRPVRASGEPVREALRYLAEIGVLATEPSQKTEVARRPESGDYPGEPGHLSARVTELEERVQDQGQKIVEQYQRIEDLARTVDALTERRAAGDT